MLLDLLTIFFIAAGCLLLWLNVRPGWRKVKRTAMKREQEITLGEMRAMGATHLLVYCGDYKCAHSHVVDAGRWPDHVRLSDLEPLFICRVCGLRGADVRPLFEPPRMGTNAQRAHRGRDKLT
jgi:hypothetical protein